MLLQRPEQVVEYVEAELKRSVPNGWRWHGEQLDPPTWRIVPEHSPTDDYVLRASMGCRLFIIEYGNSDAGAFSLNHVLLNAKVIDFDSLNMFSLAEVTSAIFRSCEPNTMGLT